MRSRYLFAILLFLLWISATSYFLYDTVWGNYGVFDNQQQWETVSVTELTPGALALPVINGIQLVHVLDEDCQCNRFTEEHIRSLGKMLTEPEAQAQVSVSALQTAGFVVPATPMALIFEHGKLIYAGPYATGPLCSVDDSLLADILSGHKILTGLWLNGETKACRCIASVIS